MIANNLPLLIVIYFPMLYREILSLCLEGKYLHAFFDKCSTIKESCSFYRGSTLYGKEPQSSNIRHFNPRYTLA